MTRKYTPLETLGKQLVEIKAAEPCAIGFWKKKCNFNFKKTQKNTHVVAVLQMYTGD